MKSIEALIEASVHAIIVIALSIGAWSIPFAIYVLIRGALQ